MEKQTKIIVGIIVIAILVLVSVFMWIFINSGLRPCCIEGGIDIYCTKDSTNKTLTVTGIRNAPDYFNWSDIEVKMGNATLPNGVIDVGDIITNCSGEVLLLFKPAGMAVGNWIFEE